MAIRADTNVYNVNEKRTAKPTEGEPTPQHNYKNYMNMGLQSMLSELLSPDDYAVYSKASTLSFHAGGAGNRLPEPDFLPTRLTGVVCHDFLRNLLQKLLQAVDLQRYSTELFFFLQFRKS
jgi:hypothetical protein